MKPACPSPVSISCTGNCVRGWGARLTGRELSFLVAVSAGSGAVLQFSSQGCSQLSFLTEEIEDPAG